MDSERQVSLFMGSGMLGMLVVLGSLTTHQCEGMIVKKYGAKHGKGGMFFNAVLCLSATLYFFVTDAGGFVLPRGVFLYGLINSTMYAVGFYSGYMAYRLGSFGLTRLFSSLSSMIAVLYGIIVLREPVSPLMLAAVALVFVSVFLMRYRKDDGDRKRSFNFRWVVSIVLVVVSNALISIIGKMQHTAFSDTYKNEYLIVSFAGSALWLVILGIVFEKDSFLPTIKHGLSYGFGAGIFNGITNVLNIVSYNFFSLSLLSPINTGLGMVISFLVSVLLYTETFTRRQVLRVILGVLAVILINI
jgi:drug/metabolite transporter (DMT)-like permease